MVLGSFLEHSSDHRVGEGLLGTCRRYVKDDGVVLIQREGAHYHSDVPREREDRLFALLRGKGRTVRTGQWTNR